MFKEINILKPFLESPQREFNVREIGRILKISPATASSKLNYFYKKDILKERKERNLLLYKANLEKELFLDIKRFYNLRKIKESGLLEEINKFYLKPVISLFGSFASGLDNNDSDIDIFIISEKNEEFPRTKTFEKKLNRKLHFFVVKDIKEIKNEHLVNNILNGAILQGTIKWV